MRPAAAFAAWLCIAGGALAATGPIAAYRTQLFNLVSREPGVIDGKNHYQAGFAARFDALLASSRLARQDKSKVALKKRLLSGPAAEGELLRAPGGAAQWVYYTACQAHRCDEVSLGLLFDPAAQRMVGKLHLDSRFEYLGAPSEAEQRLLDRNMPGG